MHLSIRQYLASLQQNLKTGQATEHTHRPALKQLIESVCRGANAINEPTRIACGAPDYVVYRTGTPLGYVEAKDVGVPLGEALKTKQLKRYLDSLDNLILTDYLIFRWFLRGEERASVELGTDLGDGKLKARPGAADRLVELLQDFAAADAPTVKTPKELAERMAALARLLRETINRAFELEEEGGAFHNQLEGFRQVLLHTLTPAQFADMYAQTISYGLFAARVHKADDGHAFSRRHAADYLPRTNPFLRRMFNQIAGMDLDPRVDWAVDDLAELLNRADMDRILRDFGKRTRQEDPVVHFYETFLAAYDAKLRETRGVYYTPEPVVSYIVRSVDHLLKTEFGLKHGLADESTTTIQVQEPHKKTKSKKEVHRVQILDPACGTGTFLFSVIDRIRERFEGDEGMWSEYVSRHLLPRLYGFEFLMAPYTIAHMKLGLQLEQSGYDFRSDERLHIYLTNTLEEAHEYHGVPLFTQWLADEANAAARVKEQEPILVILGNPPYSNFGQMNNLPWISKLMEDWKPRDERKWNPDDFMKFMRWAQWRIEKTGQGILAMITSRTYLDGLTHRQMRKRCLDTFDDIWIIDLHGGLYESSPSAIDDENVFDITQGVSVFIGVRTRSTGAERVRYDELWGRRSEKYGYLSTNSVGDYEWNQIRPDDETCLGNFYFFSPRAFSNSDDYCSGYDITRGFKTFQNAIKTDRDDLFVEFDRLPLEERMRTFFSPEGVMEPFKSAYRIQDSSSYSLLRRRTDVTYQRENVTPFAYRPYDRRWIYYDPSLVSRAAWSVMRHFLAGPNLGLIASRQTRDKWDVMASVFFVGHKSVAAYDINTFFPLYLYPDPESGDLFEQGRTEREPNLSPDFIAAVEEKTGLSFVPDGTGDLEETLGPEDIFHYMYAVFHSPEYRSRYAEFLKIDFPRLPLTSNLALFRKLGAKGKTLVGLHLLEEVPEPDVRFPVAGDNSVEKGYPKYAAPGTKPPGEAEPITKGRVYINERQYFDGIEPELFDFYVGGYQVLEKWLKDRRGRLLTYDDLTHYRKTATALRETMWLMGQIDEVIEEHGGWPIE